MNRKVNLKINYLGCERFLSEVCKELNFPYTVAYSRYKSYLKSPATINSDVFRPIHKPKYIELKGKELTVSKLSRKLKLPISTIRDRIIKNLPIFKII